MQTTKETSLFPYLDSSVTSASLVSTRAWYKRFAVVGLDFLSAIEHSHQVQCSTDDGEPAHHSIGVRGRRQGGRVAIPFASYFS